MKIVPTHIPDVKIIEPRVFGDARGFFMESWNRRVFAEAGIDADFVQDNHSRSAQWTLRGMHYQIQHPQGKLVRVLAGEVYDVAVDLRRSSPTFGRWVGVTMSDANHRMLWVPPGFAHGFIALSAVADFAYKTTDYWHPEFERVLHWRDPQLGIDWPLPEGVRPLIAERDDRAEGLGGVETYP
jgi:dTDP-4-dehydrorhamnose 3,5-epimerase